MKVIALVDLPDRRKAGEVFDAPDDQARLLVLLKQVSAVPDPPPDIRTVIDDVHVHTSRAVQEVLEAPRRGRTYRRRDQVAESSED